MSSHPEITVVADSVRDRLAADFEVGFAGRPAMPPPGYGVVVVSDRQWQQLLERRRGLLSSAVRFAWLARWRRPALVAVLAATAIAAGLAAWPRLPWSGHGEPPTLETGASFNLGVGGARGADAAASLGRRLAGLGLPVFSHAHPDRPGHQVLVGPYVSLDEAQEAERRLAARGFGSRIVVDDTLRGVPRPVVAPPGTPGLVLVSAPGRVSLTFELPAEPRALATRRVSDTTLEIDLGPIAGDVAARTWRAPAGVHLVERVALEPTAANVRARVDVPAFARADTRVVGRRVYVDLTWPNDPAAAWAHVRPVPRPPVSAAEARPPSAAAPRAAAVAGPFAPAASSGPAPAAAIDAPAAEAGDTTALRTVVETFERMLPFMQSAAASPAPDVLRALGPMIAGLEDALQDGRGGAADPASARGLLLSAADAARRAVDPAFTGDRLAESTRAEGYFEEARGRLASTD